MTDSIRTYRKKPVCVTAVQFTGHNLGVVQGFVAGSAISMRDGDIIIHTLEGDMHVSKGDYVIRGVKGEYYPCKPDIFQATYEEVGVEQP